jgi:oligopeptide transport system substrate-binding protein
LGSDEVSSQDLGVFLQGSSRRTWGCAKVTFLPFGTPLKREDSEYHQMVVSFWIPDYNDPMTLLDLWISGASFKKADISNHRYDGRIAGAKAEPDAARRMEMMAEAEMLVGGFAALAPIYYFASANVTKPSVKNYVVYPYGPASDYKYTSIEV